MSTPSQVVPPSLPEDENIDELLALAPQLARKRRSQFRIIADRFVRNRLAVAGLVVLVLMGLAALFAPLLYHATATYDPSTEINLRESPAFQGPSLQHLLGTDELGRDEMARILYGGRVSLLVGISSMFMAIFVGVLIGALAGYFGGIIDNLLMRVTDIILALPLYLLLFVLSAGFSTGSIFDVVVLIAIFGWTYTARLVRSEFLALKEREFVMAARTLGASNFRLMVRHILPNAAGPIIVSATLLVGANIITESVLSFFGFGIQVPLASWGTMVAGAEAYFLGHPILVWAPGLCILIVVLSFNLMGDGLRDALDPYLTER
jgi:peptide/nickel transport system permease protein